MKRWLRMAAAGAALLMGAAGLTGCVKDDDSGNGRRGWRKNGAENFLL